MAEIAGESGPAHAHAISDAIEPAIVFNGAVLIGAPNNMISRLTQLASIPSLEDVEMWFADLDISDGDAADLKTMLDSEEQARAARFVKPHLTRRFIASHAALRILLGRAAGVLPEAIRYRRGVKGKPALAAGVSARDVRFNLSHSRDAALIAIADGHEVGIDLEQTGKELDFKPLAKRFFAPAEYERVLSTPEESQREAFFRCWTAKEAYIKARGDGLSFGLREFEALPGEEGDVRLTVYKDAAEASRWKLSRVPAPEGWVGTMAIEVR